MRNCRACGHRCSLQSAALLLAVTMSAAAGERANAAIVAIDPFTGDASETFDQYSNTVAAQTLPVFGGAGSLMNLSAGGAIKVEFSSQFQGYQVLPINDMMGGQLGVAQWVFNQPISRFGGWFENNSGADDATLTFYDVNNLPIQTLTANVAFAEGWTWNGWSSDTPISRIVVTGNGVVNGFLWYENMQIDFAEVPAPPALLVLVVGVCRPSRARR